MRGLLAVALPAVALAALLASPSAACPGCMANIEGNRVAYLGTAALLSLLPLGMAGGGLLWLRRRARALDAREAADSD